jgi:hypothetical protein
LFEVTGRPGKDWPPAVVRWWDAWRRSPQARLFVGEVEWQALGRAALMLELYFDPECPASVRVQVWQALARFEGLLGATHSDRVRSQIRVKPAEPVPVVGSPRLVPDYRELLRPVDDP